ncbi:MAG: CehA/McbA family metallohydrolase, partial [Candidatus Hydrogenedentes bacterium]|nr:CehA/McbA family metallohydrolase [Candidatus Hydrogenedentota bacterium]
ENLTFTLTDGVGGTVALRGFDKDYDLVMDSVELKMKTNPNDPSDFPHAEPVPFDSPVLEKKAGWLKGDLHVKSVHGGGAESVAELVKRAEQSGLDFIAITDRNTMDACFDADFKSNKVVLIPAMEWGNEQRGMALIYGPRTMPEITNSFKEDQGVCQRVQAQGGIFVVATPCFPTAPWQRGLSYVNGIEVWCRDYRAVPGIKLENLVEEYQRKVDGKLIYSISMAANTQDLSANGQATMFWDYELTRGLKAACVAGSMSSSPKVPMGKPITYVYAPEKSVRGILYGLRMGRTTIAADADAPTIEFYTDVRSWKSNAETAQAAINNTLDPNAKAAPQQAVKVGKPEISLGGIVPLGMPVDLYLEVKNAKGMKMEILRNGWPIVTKKIETDKVELLKTTDTPNAYCNYRARVIRAPQAKGIGPVDVVAMTSPIYAQDIVPIDPTKKNPLDINIRVDKPGAAPPAKVSEVVEEGGKKRVRFENGAPVQPVQPDNFNLPPDAKVNTLKPKKL